ncbi:MAG TPA: sulfite exporter TauE/SafE family protein [Gemmatimonadales bacterium]
MTGIEWFIAAAVVLIGAILQGSIGFGLGMVAAPLLILIDPRFVPGPLLATAVVVTLFLARRDWHAVQVRDLAWALSGRFWGVLAAVYVLTVVSPERIAILFGVLILGAVGLSASGLHLAPTRGTLVLAGILSGFMGTTVSIGGPPMALVYQRVSGARIRGTLSAYFVVGILFSLLALRLAGRLGATELRMAGGLIPGALVGIGISSRTVTLLDRGYTRPAVLAVSAAAGLLVIAKYLLFG